MSAQRRQIEQLIANVQECSAILNRADNPHRHRYKDLHRMLRRDRGKVDGLRASLERAVARAEGDLLLRSELREHIKALEAAQVAWCAVLAARP